MTSWRILCGDVREQLATLDAGSARTCVTSPPYWGLRDYGTGAWVGGDPACSHLERLQHREQPGRPTQDGVFRHTSTPQPVPFEGTCGRCGAQREDAQIGLEQTPEAYVAALVDVFRHVRRVLTPDGTLWLNLGDSYASKARGSDVGWDKSRLTNPGNQQKAQAASLRSSGERHRGKSSGLKNKDLVGIPWMVAFALRADGWYLRSDVIWSKPNPMPESVTDRPSQSHEHVFLLAKSETYFYDADAIREPTVSLDPAHPSYRPNSARIAVEGRTTTSAKHAESARSYSTAGRNARNVWTITTKPFRGAHFAVMPWDLAERCILAGSEPGDIVLDPFAGAATTGVVALRRERSFVGTELNPEYVELARERIVGDAPLFNGPAETVVLGASGTDDLEPSDARLAVNGGLTRD